MGIFNIFIIPMQSSTDARWISLKQAAHYSNIGQKRLISLAESVDADLVGLCDLQVALEAARGQKFDSPAVADASLWDSSSFSRTATVISRCLR